MSFVIQALAFIVVIILQMVVVSSIPLLHGTADLLLLWVGAWALMSHSRVPWIYAGVAALAVAYTSAIHPIVPFGAYFFVVIFAKFFQRRIWQSPLMALFVICFAGSLLESGLSYVILSIGGVPLDFSTSLVQVIIPSLFLNLLLALPVYAISRDMHQWLYPYEVEI